MSNRLLTFRVFSFDLHQTTVCDSLALADMQISSLNREKRKSMGSQRIIEGEYVISYGMLWKAKYFGSTFVFTLGKTSCFNSVSFYIYVFLRSPAI